MIRVLLVDDHQMLLDGIAAFLAAESSIEVVGTAASGKEALARYREAPVDVVVLDYELPDMNGTEVTKQLRAQSPDVRVIILSMYKRKHFVRAALTDAGAMGYVLKERSKEALVGAIHHVAKGERYIPPEIMDIVFEAEPTADEPLPAELTRSQREVLKLYAIGHTAREIGSTLYISENTAKKHLQNIRNRLGIQTKLQLAEYAKRHDLI